MTVSGTGILAFEFPGIGNLPFELSEIMGNGKFLGPRFCHFSIFSDSRFEKIAELPGAAAPGPHHFAWILDRGLKADNCLQWLNC